MWLLGSLVLLAKLELIGCSSSCYVSIDGSPIMCSSCGGSCTAVSGCQCANQTSCLPENGTCGLNSPACCLPGFSWNPNIVCCVEGPYCSPQCLPDESCTLVNQIALCTLNSTIYQNQNLDLNNLTSFVTCNRGIMTVSVNKNLLEFLQYTPINATLSDPSCTGANVSIVNGKRVYSVTVPGRAGTCGNIMSKSTSQVTYTNTLVITKYSSIGILSTRKISAQFSCTYNLTMDVALSTVIKPVMSSQILATGGSGAEAITTIAAYDSSSYTQPIMQTNQEQLTIGSTLYFGMFTLFPDPVFVLRVETCYSTPTSDGSGSIKVMLIQGGCPTSDGPYIKVEENGQSKEVRFSVVMFAFSGYETVYIFCETRLCNTASSSCNGLSLLLCSLAVCCSRDSLRPSDPYRSQAIRSLSPVVFLWKS
uniref:ZP domain-containing protein n=1 Tax=Leptobrachium leishanense TaxID=445787 RepID=A0A8C5M1C4_9ANUR